MAQQELSVLGRARRGSRTYATHKGSRVTYAANVGLREQEQDLLDRLMAIERDGGGDELTFRAQRVTGRGEMLLAYTVDGEQKFHRAPFHDLQALDRADMIRTSGVLGDPGTRFTLSQRGRANYRERHTHTMTVIEPVLPPGERVLD